MEIFKDEWQENVTHQNLLNIENVDPKGNLYLWMSPLKNDICEINGLSWHSKEPEKNMKKLLPKSKKKRLDQRF